VLARADHGRGLVVEGDHQDVAVPRRGREVVEELGGDGSEFVGDAETGPLARCVPRQLSEHGDGLVEGRLGDQPRHQEVYAEGHTPRSESHASICGRDQLRSRARCERVDGSLEPQDTEPGTDVRVRPPSVRVSSPPSSKKPRNAGRQAPRPPQRHQQAAEGHESLEQLLPEPVERLCRSGGLRPLAEVGERGICFLLGLGAVGLDCLAKVDRLDGHGGSIR
jgi:hypothetical protein